VKLQTRLFLNSLFPSLALILIVGAVQWTARHNKAEMARAVETAAFSDLARQMQLQVRDIKDMLTALSATREAAEVKDVFNYVGKTRDAFHKNVDRFRAHYTARNDTKRLEQLKAIDADIDALVAAGQEMTLAYIKKGTAEGTDLMTKVDDISDRLRTGFESFVEEQVGQFNSLVADVAAAGSRFAWFGLIGGALVVVLVLLVSWLASRSISRRIFAALELIREGGESVAATSTEISGASKVLSQGSTEQAASLEETAASLEEMSSMAKGNAGHTQNARTAAAEARQTAEAAAGRVHAMQIAMNEIQTASRDITKILKTIDEIAFQTNILALNAAVEAGNAGEAGRGFAVVAEEVRSLAQRCAAAAKETAVKIEDSVGKSQQGVALSGEVAENFTSIQTQIQTLDRLINEIATASAEQNEGTAQVNTAIGEVDKITQSNAAIAEECAASVVELSREAETLTQTVGQLLRLVGGRRQRDPLGRGGDPKPGGRRKIDRAETPPIANQNPPAGKPALRRPSPALSSRP